MNMPGKMFLWQLPRILHKHCHKSSCNFLLLFKPQLIHLQSVHNISSSSIKPVTLAYEVHDTVKSTHKEPIIVMHGLFGYKQNWHTPAKLINSETKRKVIAIDARNHGNSPHTPDMTYQHMAQDIIQLCHDLSIKRATYIGHSMGGSAMMYFALHFPEFVEKLVVVDMSPVRTSPSLHEIKTYIDVLLCLNLNYKLSLSVARNQVIKALRSNGASVTIAQFIASNLVRRGDDRSYTWRFNLPVIAKEFVNIATFPDVESRTFSGPTLFIAGGKSNYIKPADHDGIKQLFPRAEITYFWNAHHWVHFSEPHSFVNTVTNFVNQDICED